MTMTIIAQLHTQAYSLALLQAMFMGKAEMGDCLAKDWAPGLPREEHGEIKRRQRRRSSFPF
jgi:hypothetical protein